MLLTPLNRDSNSNAAVISTSSKKTTKEAQESACFQEYHDALKLQRDGDLNGAKALYQHLLQSSFLSIEEGSGGNASTTAAKLKYSICRNLAGIFKDQGDLSVAIDTYLKATNIDDSDITTWLQLSRVAQLQGNLLIARMALEKAIECSPDHWQSLDQLCKVLFTIQDNPACLSKCSIALERNPFYIRGLVYVNHILREDGNTLWIRQFEDLKKYSSNYQEAVSSSHAAECLEEAKSLREKWCQHCKDEEKTLMPTWKPVNPQKDLFDINWLSLGRWLLFAWDYYRDLVWAGKNSWCSKLEFPNIDAVRPIVLKYTSPTHSSSSISDAVKPSPTTTNAGEGIPKSSPQKRKASEAVPASDQNVTPKRRSSRAAKAKRHDIPPCYFDMLKKYIPERFGMSQLESLQSLDLSPLRKKPNMGSIGKRSSAALLSPTKVLSTDTSDSLRQFVADHINNRGVVSVVFDFLKHLAVHYDWVWPFPLGGVFVELYQKVEQHLAQPSPLCNQLEPNELEHLKDFVRVSLTYCELLVDSQCKVTVGKKKGTDKTLQHPASPALPLVDGLIPLILFSVSKFEGKEKDHILFRVVWLLAQVKMTRNDPVTATGHVLELCHLLEGYKGSDNVIIYLCNLHHDPYISLAHAKDRVNSLERSLSLEKINSLYQNSSYSEVVDHLLPVLDQESGSYTEFLIGSTQLVGNQRQQRTSSLYLLLSSLLKLNRIEECLCCAVLAVEELLTHSNTNSDLWTSSVYSTFEIVNKCILEEPKLLSKPSQQSVVKVLIVQICRVLNIMFDVDTPLVHTLPVCLAWKIFYHIVKGEEKDEEDDTKRDNMAEESSSTVTAPAASSDVVDGATSSASALQGNNAPSKDTSNNNGDAQSAQTVANNAPTTPDVRARSSSSSELLSPMHDHTYALPSPLITPTMMAAIDNHSVSHKGYTCLSRVGQISVPPQQPAENNSLKKSVEFLKEAHTHLGTLGWCCWDNGCLLVLSVQVLRKELNRLTAFSPKHRDILLRELEQCYYCLYGHPKKASRAKARGLKEHGAIPVELTWEAALLLMEYFHPTSLPSVEDNKYGWGGLSGLCADLLTLYKRIVDIVPKKLGQVIDCDNIHAFIDGNSTQLPQPRPAHPHSTLIAELYYILADDALKSNDTNKAMKYYLSDLSYCPERFDSWAGLSLAKSRKIIDKIQQCDAKSGAEKFIQKHACGVLRCFERAVALNDKNCFVIEKYGFFVYTLQAYASQITKQQSMYTGEELHAWAKDLRQKALLLSKNCFTQALSLAGTKSAQPWLYQYMLGKTYYKLEMPINICLESLCNALQTLDREGAIYPRNVDLTTKYFAKEGIEVCYQFYSVLLKCMIAGKGNEISSKVLSDMKELPLSILICPEATTFADNIIPPLCDKTIRSKEGDGVVASKLTPVESSTTIIMDALLMDAFPPSQEDNITVIPETPEGSQKRKQEEEQEQQQQDQQHQEQQPQQQQQQEQPLSNTKAPVESASQTSVESTSQASAVDCLGTMTLETLDIPSYIDRQMLHHSICVLVSLLLRFPIYFKPLYRLAWVFHKLKAFKLAKMCLLGPPPPMFQQGKILPLFVLKSNVFTNLWQIPGEELNRPGSFSTHARTNLQLLVSVLLELDDLTSLTSLALNLRNKPDPSKQYLRDTERQVITKALVVLCVEMLKKQAAELRGDSTNADELFAKGASVKLLASKPDVGSKELSKEVAVVLSDLASKATPL